MSTYFSKIVVASVFAFMFCCGTASAQPFNNVVPSVVPSVSGHDSLLPLVQVKLEELNATLDSVGVRDVQLEEDRENEELVNTPLPSDYVDSLVIN
ncbi:hypothetical protein [Teredinibacter haidensis]|uniref:hypothetical protein n=1 Tax=Teredinibacter haidensis TaxID=2731755 RepID=UPI0009490A22|nr:hypothetical protein [Teredinibacter haidensis]